MLQILFCDIFRYSFLCSNKRQNRIPLAILPFELLVIFFQKTPNNTEFVYCRQHVYFKSALQFLQVFPQCNIVPGVPAKINELSLVQHIWNTLYK